MHKSWQSLRRQAAVARSASFAHGLRPWIFFKGLLIWGALSDEWRGLQSVVRHDVSEDGFCMRFQVEPTQLTQHIELVSVSGHQQSQSQSQSHIAADGQSVSMSWCQAQILDI
jgi:hypothetical protein